MRRKLSAGELDELIEAPVSGAAESKSLPDVRWAYREAAAVLAWFDPAELRPVGDFPPGEAAVHLISDITLAPSHGLGRRWLLDPELREEALKGLVKRDAIGDALAANHVDSPAWTLPQVYRAFLRGERPELDGLDESALSNVLQSVTWLEGILPNLPAPAEIRARIREQRLLAPYRALAGEHFHGRDDELSDLRDHLGVLPPDSLRHGAKRVVATLTGDPRKPLAILGPGGVGKSTLIARFILEHARLVGHEPLAFVYLDFDDPFLYAADWRTWVRFGVRQLRTQVDLRRREVRGGVPSDFDELADRIAEAIAQSSGRADAPPLPEHNLVRDLAALARSAASDSATHGDPRFLLVIDTFEDFQYHGTVALQGLAEFLACLADTHRGLRTVIAGRRDVSLPGVKIKTMPLGPLGDDAAEAYLRDREVPPDLAHAVVEHFGGNPLTLRLAATVLVDDQEEIDELLQIKTRRTLGLRRVQEARIQGWLYDRHLDRISDDEVRNIAKAGLVTRAITVEVIEGILQPALGGASIGDPAALLHALDGILERTEGGALRHRTDVRAEALPLLGESEPELVRRVDEQAVTHYREREDPTSRAEEIYHLLRLGAKRGQLEERWDEAARPMLYSALPELSATERVWLAGRLGVTVDEEDRRNASLEEWERQAAVAARDLLSVGRPKEALKRLRERRGGGALSLYKAWALLDLDDLSQARKVVRDALREHDETLDRDPGERVGLHVLAAQIAERDRNPTDARRELEQAAHLAERGDALRRLRIDLKRIDLATRFGEDAERAEVRRALARHFGDTPDETLHGDLPLARRCAAQLEDDPVALARAVRIAGLGELSEQERSDLAGGLAGGDSSAAELGSSLGRTFTVDPEAAPEQRWYKIVDRAEGAGRLDEVVTRMLDAAGNSRELRTQVAGTLSKDDEPPDIRYQQLL